MLRSLVCEGVRAHPIKAQKYLTQYEEKAKKKLDKVVNCTTMKEHREEV